MEEVFGSLSLLLNGGGVAQIKTIATELNKALKGNEPEIRSLLTNLDHLVGALDARKGDITTALDGLNRLSATLNEAGPRSRTRWTTSVPGSRSSRRSGNSSSTCCSRSTGCPAWRPMS